MPPSGKDVAAYLSRHGVKVVTERVRTAEVTVTNTLFRLIESENIDLLVAGAYGHSRVRRMGVRWHYPRPAGGPADLLPVLALNDRETSMSYAALMVHLGAHDDWQGRVRLAADLAHRFQAALIGIAGWLSSPAFAIDDIAADQDTADMPKAGTWRLVSPRWASNFAPRPSRSATSNGAACSIIRAPWSRARRAPPTFSIIGRERVAGDPYFSLNPGNTILRAGRPVLVVPRRHRRAGCQAGGGCLEGYPRVPSRGVRRTAVSAAAPMRCCWSKSARFGAEAQSEQQMSDVGSLSRRGIR